MKKYLEFATFSFFIMCINATNNTIIQVPQQTTERPNEPNAKTSVNCLCGVFLSGQFKKGSKELSKGNPVLVHETNDIFPCSSIGNKMCTNRCLDNIVKHLPNSSNILCASLDKDCYKEKASLFIKNCKDVWINTNLSTGREYCCKNGAPYKCT